MKIINIELGNVSKIEDVSVYNSNVIFNISEKGESGKTPVRGIDYMTEEDIQSITSMVIEREKTYIFEQISPSKDWHIEHNLDKYPSVTVVDTGDNLVIGEVQYINKNEILIIFTSAFSGKAYLN